jgi:hypothetical protein
MLDSFPARNMSHLRGSLAVAYFASSITTFLHFSSRLCGYVAFLALRLLYAFAACLKLLRIFTAHKI